MGEFLTSHAYLLIGLLVGAIAVWAIFFRSSGDPERRRPLSPLVWGPFAPYLSDYLTRRGGFTRREIVGWLIVLLVAIVAIILTPSRGP
jgi:hypothetical protein